MRNVVLDNLEGLLHPLVRKATDTIRDDLLLVVGDGTGFARLGDLALLVSLSRTEFLGILLGKLRLANLLGGRERRRR